MCGSCEGGGMGNVKAPKILSMWTDNMTCTERHKGQVQANTSA